MDLSTWISGAHEDVCARLRSQVLARVPHERWREPPCDRSASIVWLLWHATRHQDVAINVIVRGGVDLLTADDRVGRVGSGSFAPGLGLSESVDRGAADALVPSEVQAYAEAVWSETARWLTTLDPAELDRVPDARAGLTRLGIDLDEYGWLERMWAGKPVAFHLSWETIGHGYLHLGEMVHVRNELGLGGR